MKRIEYHDITTLIEDYQKAICSYDNNILWHELRTELLDSDPNIDEDIFPLDFADIVTGKFEVLAEIYVEYVERNIKIRFPDLHKKLKGLFNYDYNGLGTPTHNSIIAQFFISHKDNIDLSSCYYCEMSYINVYGGDLLDLLNNGTKSQLIHHLRYSERTIDSIIKERKAGQFKDNKDFDSRIHIRNIDFKSVENRSKNNKLKAAHFDLDHFLDKGSCPIIALSLFNLIPSCPICNERIKHSKSLGNNDLNLLRLFSPSSPDYDFENKVKIAVKPTDMPLSYVDAQDKYHLTFECEPGSVYREEVDFFRLEERYDFHKIDALRLMDLKRKYDNEKYIKSISKMIYGDDRPEHLNKVKDDIFQIYFRGRSNRTFSKLYRDILS